MIGAGSGVGLALATPVMMGRESIGEPFLALAGWLIAFAAVLGSAIGLWGRWTRRRLLDNHRGLDSIRSLSWSEFERLVGEAYRRRGYQVTETGGGGADGGIDLDLRGAGGRILIQCKHWKNIQVGVREVRELAGVISSLHADGGAVISTGTFTRAAVDFAATVRIDLIDGPSLERMLEGLSTNGFAPNGKGETNTGAASPSPACPSCGSPMVHRIARRGSRAGSAFWGCSTYPSCRTTLQAA